MKKLICPKSKLVDSGIYKLYFEEHEIFCKEIKDIPNMKQAFDLYDLLDKDDKDYFFNCVEIDDLGYFEGTSLKDVCFKKILNEIKRNSLG